MLQRNKIYNLEDNTLRNLFNLIKLDLSGNGLKSINGKQFKDLINIEELILQI
ncbi:hypothetical protein [Candidatus Cytomitobacter indipagum]|uniref:hypothetical protein n=1 Tax=Candidatus Cytomitobacter indipagum TaxID=2601575 RepID=UPI00387E6811